MYLQGERKTLMLHLLQRIEAFLELSMKNSKLPLKLLELNII